MRRSGSRLKAHSLSGRDDLGLGGVIAEIEDQIRKLENEVARLED